MSDPAAEFDGPWKEALGWYFGPFLAFFFPAAHAEIDWSRGEVPLDAELQQIAPEAEAGRGTVDKLVKVWTRDGEEAWVLVHVEVQSQRDADFARRMYAYNHRLEDKYGRMPASLAVLGDEVRSWRPGPHRGGRWGCEVRFTFPAVKLVDYRDREAGLAADPNPFAAIVLAHLKTQETRGDPAARHGWKVRLVKSLYDRGLDRERVVRLFRLIDWMMALPPVPQNLFRREIADFEKERQMPFISPTERIWLEEGKEAGRTEGRYEGIEAVLEIRFGADGLALMPRVRKLTDAGALADLLRFLRTAPDVDAVRGRLPAAD
jgi:hypothetical protein